MHRDPNPPTTLGKSATTEQRTRESIIGAGDSWRPTMATPARGIVSRPPTTGTGHPWDQAAEGWSRHGPLLGEWLRDVTSAMLDATHIGPGSRVLDIAAGAGNQTLDIARRVGASGHVLATDISAHSLVLAQEKLRAAGFDRVETRVADAQALDLSGARFDAAIFRLGLMFCRAPLDALRGVRAALKPGGHFSALVFSGPQGNPCIAILVSTAMRHAGLCQASASEPGTLLSLGQTGLLAELLDAAGFVDIEVRAVSAPMRLPTCQDYIDFVRTAGLPIMAILAPLSAVAQAAAWRDMAAQLDQFNTSTGWVGPNELLLCAATRPAPLAELDHPANA